jgi:hypothetical protein
VSDSTEHLDTISASQASKEVTANAMHSASAPAMLFGRRNSTSSGLTWGYIGGRMDGTAVANGTVSLTASQTNYVVAHRTTLAVTVSTATTNWDDTSTYGRMYKVVTDGTAATSWEDHRAGNGGILSGGSSTPTGTGFRHVTADVEDGTAVAVDLSGSDATGTLAAARFPALTGHVTTSAGSVATTLSSSVELPGTPTVQTPPSAGDNSAKVATTAWAKAYADSIASGLDVKASVRAATTANIALSGAQTIDGVSVIAGDRVLVKDQSTGADNGIYVAAAGAWSRAGDADTSAEVTSGMFTFVVEGTANVNTGWVLTTADPITLGSTALTFTKFSNQLTPAGGSSPQLQYNNAGGFGGMTKVEAANGRLNLLSDTATPATPSDGAVVFARDWVGRQRLAIVDENGIAQVLQPSWPDCHVRYMTSNAAANQTSFGFNTFTLSAGMSARTLATTNLLTSTVYGAQATGTGAGTSVYAQTPDFCWRGNAAGLGGFYCSIRFGLELVGLDARGFFGLKSASGGLGIGNVDPDTLTDLIGVGANHGEANLSLINNDASGAATKSDLGANFPFDVDLVYEIHLACKPNDSAIYWGLRNLSSGNSTSGSVSSDLPANTVFLSLIQWVNNGVGGSGAYATTQGVMQMYGETPT